MSSRLCGINKVEFKFNVEMDASSSNATYNVSVSNNKKEPITEFTSKASLRLCGINKVESKLNVEIRLQVFEK